MMTPLLVALNLLLGSEIVPGPGSVVSVKSAAPINVTSGRSPTISLAQCPSVGQIYVWTGTAFTCQFPVVRSIPTCASGQFLTSDGGLICANLPAETDPVFTTSPARRVTDAGIAHWDESYSWGNHALAGYLLTEIDPSVNTLGKANLTCTFGQVPMIGDGGWYCAIPPSTPVPVCPSGQFLTSDGGLICAALPAETDPTVNDLGKAALSCVTDYVPVWTGSVWTCSVVPETDPYVNTLGKAALSCTSGQVPMMGDGGWLCGTVASALRRCSTDDHDVLVYRFEEHPLDGGPIQAFNSGVGDPTDAGVGDSHYVLKTWGTEPTQAQPGSTGLFEHGLAIGINQNLPYFGIGSTDGIGRPGVGGITVSFWLADGTPSNAGRGCTLTSMVFTNALQFWYNNGSVQLHLRWVSTTTFGTLVFTGAQQLYTRESAWYPGPMGKWQYWAASWDPSGAGTIRVYRSVSGGGPLDLVGTISSAGLPLGTGNLAVGAANAAGYCAENGIYDEVRVANVARTKAELEACYRMALPMGDYP